MLSSSKNIVLTSNLSGSLNSSANQKITIGTTSALRRKFKRRDILPVDMQVLWKVEKGVVRTASWGEDGVCITLGYWGEGDIIGYPLSKINPFQIECLSDVELNIIPKNQWNTEIYTLISCMSEIEVLATIIHQKQVTRRLEQFLYFLCEKFGEDCEDGIYIKVPLTYQEIAEVLNTTRVTITRALQEFEDTGKISRKRRQIILKQKARLKPN